MRLITKKLPPKDDPGSIKLVAEEGEKRAGTGVMMKYDDEDSQVVVFLCHSDLEPPSCTLFEALWHSCVRSGPV